jgi:hypothetical protein
LGAAPGPRRGPGRWRAGKNFHDTGLPIPGTAPRRGGRIAQFTVCTRAVAFLVGNTAGADAVAEPAGTDAAACLDHAVSDPNADCDDAPAKRAVDEWVIHNAVAQWDDAGSDANYDDAHTHCHHAAGYCHHAAPTDNALTDNAHTDADYDRAGTHPN